jgi:hypothetical protein
MFVYKGETLSFKHKNDWFTFKKGDKVKPDFAELIKSKGGIVEEIIEEKPVVVEETPVVIDDEQVVIKPYKPRKRK